MNLRTNSKLTDPVDQQPASRRIRVLIVDDSAIVRKLLTQALEREPDIEVVGTAPDAFVARNKVLALRPDVLTLDIEMPGMDGITFLRKLMQARPMPVIIISSLGHSSCRAGMDALRAGAVEILCKPSGSCSVGELSLSLPAKVRTAAAARVRPQLSPTHSLPTLATRKNHVSPSEAPARAHNRIIAIGASTGGPQAISQILEAMPADCAPIVVVQHMPRTFTGHFAERLNASCRIAVKEAEDDDALIPGRALIAPGDRHMMLRRNNGQHCVQLGDGPLVCFSRPSVDVLFSSIPKADAKNVIGVLLTGMGKDGARGLLHLRENGADTIAENEASCVVFGMPREAIQLGAAAVILPLDSIAPRLIELTHSTVVS